MNFTNMIYSLCFISVFHFIITPCIKCMVTPNGDTFTGKAATKIIDFFSLTVYVRFVMEAYLMLCLSTVSELSHFNTSCGKKISLIICILFAIIVVFILIFVFYRGNINYELQDKSKFRELYWGIWDSRWSRLNIFLFLLVRILGVVIVILLEMKPILFTCLFACYLIYMLIIRPYKAIKDNIGETSCLISICICSFLLIFLDSKDHWNTTLEYVYIAILIIGAFTGPAIWVMWLSVMLVKRLRKWKINRTMPKTAVVKFGAELEDISMHRSRIVNLKQKTPGILSRNYLIPAYFMTLW